MTSRPRVRLIYNPSSGRETMRQALSDLLDILESSGLEVSCHRTKAGGDATQAARAAAQDGFEYVIAAGGDGTVHEVINGLAIEPADQRPIVGILPAGTSNDLAHALGIPRDLYQAAEVIAKRNCKPFDIGMVTMSGSASVRGDAVESAADDLPLAHPPRYFVNIAGCGKLMEITYEVPSKQKTILGGLAYYFKGLEKLPQLHPIHLDIESEEFNFSGKAMLCFVANSKTVAGFEKLAPEAQIDDGLLDVILVKDVNLAEAIRLAALALRGEHLASQRIEYFQTKSVTITSPETVEINLDGEYGGQLPRTFSVLQHHLQILV